jgi:hypothetical protein
VLPPEESCPGDSARVLALQEKRLGLAILESENLAVATDVELALESHHQQLLRFPLSIPPRACCVLHGLVSDVSTIEYVARASFLEAQRTLPG